MVATMARIVIFVVIKAVHPRPDRAKPAIAINLFICISLNRPITPTSPSKGIVRLSCSNRSLRTVARRFEIDQGLYDDRAGTSVVQREFED